MLGAAPAESFQPRVTLLAALLVLVLAFSSLSITGAGIKVNALSPNLNVTTEAQNGTVISGYWVVVANMSGVTLQTGFSPAGFLLSTGSYEVGVADYGGWTFNQWSDGVTTRFHPFDISASGSVNLTAMYCPPQGCAGSSIQVNSVWSNGSALNGMYVVLQQGGNTVATGFTPATFTTTSGLSYSITAADYINTYFNTWTNGDSTRTIFVTANSSAEQFTAAYTATPQPPPPTANSIMVVSHDLNGTELDGLYVDIRINGTAVQSGFTPYTFTGLQIGVQYGVVIYWYGDYFFRHYADGNLQRYDLLTLNATAGQNTATLDALFEDVPASQATTLNILAEFPNGTLIGTSEFTPGYIQHTPGMWLTVAPPGTTIPYTGTFTGGSILPFTFFINRVYTVAMTMGYGNITFSHWQDNNSTSLSRAVDLTGPTTLVAIYVQT